MTHKALTKSTTDLKANSAFPDGLLPPVTSLSEVTSLDQEGTSRIPVGEQNIPILDISVTNNEVVLMDDRFISSFPNAQQSPSLKSFTEDYNSGSYPVKPTTVPLESLLLAPSLPVLTSSLDYMETLQTTLQRAAYVPHVPSPYLKPFDLTDVTLTPSKDLQTSTAHFNGVEFEGMGATSGKEWESSLFHVFPSTSSLFDTTVEGSPLFMRQLSEDTRSMPHIMTGSTNTYTEAYHSVNSSARGTLGVSSSALSILKGAPISLANTGSVMFSTTLFVSSPVLPAVVQTVSGGLFSEELFTYKFSHKASKSTAVIFPGNSEMRTQVEFFGDSTSSVPFTRPHAPCSYCDVTSVPSEPVFSVQPSDNDVGSGDYIETLSFMATEVKDATPFPSVVSDLYDMQESSPEIFDTTFPLRPVVSFSSMFTEVSNSNAVEFSLKNVFTSVSPFPHFDQSSENLLESTSIILPSSVTEITMLMSGIMEEQPSVVMVPHESAFVETVSTLSMTIRNSNLLETPALMPSEATRVFDTTVEGFSTEDFAVNRPDIPSSLSLTPFSSEPNVPYLSPSGATSSLVMPSDSSTLLPHISPTFLPSSLLFDNSSWGSAQLPAVAITSSEASQSSLWQPSLFLSNPSSFLVLQSSTTVPTSSFDMNSYVFLEPISITVMESEFYFTSAFSGDTSQFESSSIAIDATVPMQVLPTSVSEPVFTSNILGDEPNVTLWFSSLQMTPVLTSESLFPSVVSTTPFVEGTGATANLSTVSFFTEAAPTTHFFTTTPYMPPLVTEVSSIRVSAVESVSIRSSAVSTEMPSSVKTSTESGIPTAPSGTEFSSITTSTATTTSSKTGLPEMTTSTTQSSSASYSTSVLLPTPEVTMAAAPVTTTRQSYVCDITVPDKYLVIAGKNLFKRFFNFNYF